MTQVEIMFDNILGLLKNVVSDSEVETYQSILTDSRKDEFMSILEVLMNEIPEIEKARNGDQLYPSYDILETNLDLLFSKFSDYPPLSRHNELKTIIVISKVISDKVTDLTDKIDIGDGLFEVFELENPNLVPQHHYLYENGSNFEDSIVLFSISNYGELDSKLRSIKCSVKLLFILLSKIGTTTSLVGTKHLLIRAGYTAYKKQVESFLLLQMVADGDVIHISQSHKLPINNPWRDSITLKNKYQQFFDVFDVISEYNSSKDILEKYLKQYHIIEDYMYKSVLVKLERERGGNIFSLRDFKRLNEQVSKNEYETLKDFINSVFPLYYDEISYPRVTFVSHIFSEWTAYVGSSKLSVDEVLELFKINDGGVSGIQLINFAKSFSNLVYYIRNSIVHNKTTEFHLTYKTLTPEIFRLLDQFLIPNLEKIIFYLTINPTSKVVWFKNSALKIYDEN